MTATPRRFVYGALTAAAVTITASITATLTAVFLGVIVGSVAGVLLGAPAVPLGLWVGSRARRPDRPPTLAPDVGPALAALEAASEQHRHDDAQAFADRIAAAECDALGHDPGPDHGLIEVVAWGFTEPFVAGPRCQRCGRRLDPVEGNENGAADVRMSKEVTHSDRMTPESEGGIR
ncbi:hypothetical protein [Actinomadura sp. WMMA1423]|uniref:hypothetical protein n=1 Tax=Actinomadura sp. WMMA1423 TaxID=2591108 RepID=UPI00114733D2|nr:hypothetical protein [Actinomadura sp. WMMA1423]